jgi:hypothetical protein
MNLGNIFQLHNLLKGQAAGGRPVTSILSVPGQCPPMSGSIGISGDTEISAFPDDLHVMLFKVYAM